MVLSPCEEGYAWGLNWVGGLGYARVSGCAQGVKGDFFMGGYAGFALLSTKSGVLILAWDRSGDEIVPPKNVSLLLPPPSYFKLYYY